MLNTKLGFFYVHRYHFLDVKNMVALYEICRYLLYAIIAFGCLSHIIFAQRWIRWFVWRQREMAAVLASVRVQENLPKNAKLSTICYKQIPRCRLHRRQLFIRSWIVRNPCPHMLTRVELLTNKFCSSAMPLLLSWHWFAYANLPCYMLPWHGSLGLSIFAWKEVSDDEVPRSDLEACPLRGR